MVTAEGFLAAADCATVSQAAVETILFDLTHDIENLGGNGVGFTLHSLLISEEPRRYIG